MTESAPPPLGPVPPPATKRFPGRLRVRSWFLLAGTCFTVVFAVMLAVLVKTVDDTRAARDLLVEVVDPATLHALRLATALTTQESAIRIYARTHDPQYLREYRTARQAQAEAEARFTALLPRMPTQAAIRPATERLTAAAQAWQRDYAEAVIAQVPQDDEGTLARRLAPVNQARFDAVRTALIAHQGRLAWLHDIASDRLEAGWRTLDRTLLALVALLLMMALAFTLIVRQAVLRPIATLTRQVRAVSGGDFGHRIQVGGPAELAELAGHVDAMRRRILTEWRHSAEARQRLSEQTGELRRSNAELEQFAYVASHDLQEPLRKVAGFTKLLEQRYGDRLDERGRQYITFAVDGAKRMQLLINDLLDFSRVGRMGGGLALTDSGEALRIALDNLAAQIEAADAVVTNDEMPMVTGNRTLLIQLFQNLVGNAVKFRSEEPPRIHIGVRRTDGMWEFSCADNGIGVDDKYADRIFLIFQRLHPRDVYPGTGIGLALCKKIVEYHGGSIWMDPPDPERRGTTFRFTLPAVTDADAGSPGADARPSGADTDLPGAGVDSPDADAGSPDAPGTKRP